MYYVDTNTDILVKHQMIKEQQEALFSNVCCNQKKNQ